MYFVKILKWYLIYGGFDFCYFKDLYCLNSFFVKVKVFYNCLDYFKWFWECLCIGVDYMEIECKVVCIFISNLVE